VQPAAIKRKSASIARLVAPQAIKLMDLRVDGMFLIVTSNLGIVVSVCR